MKLTTKFVPQHLIVYFDETTDKFSINTPLRVSHFLAQVMHESNSFKSTEENLSYSAKRLMEVFPKYFPTKSLAVTYERKPEAIACKVYANRLGNGNENSDEGWKYRGRGYIQITGKENYKMMSDCLGVDFITNPDFLSLEKYAMLSAGCFWHKKKLNLIADKGNSVEVIKAITKIVNGGLNGIDDRIKRFNDIYKAL